MADKEKMMPGTKVLEEGSSQLASDRAKRISSLHRSVDDLVQEQNKKRLQVSNEISSLTKEQQKLMKQLEFERSEFTSDTASAYSGVIKGLGNTIKQLSLGVKNITVDTANASSDAIKQYSKAVGEDININKTNTIAMALSKATPLFGYFAAKFMETDVFQEAGRRIKDKIGDAVSSGLSKAGHSVAGIFKKGKEAEQYNMREDFGAVTSEVSGLRQQIEKEPPKLQTGGYVKEGGLVEVHAAEVITPIDKLLKEIDESRSTEIAKRLGVSIQLMSQTMNRLETVVVEREKTQKNVVATFIDEFQRARNPRVESWQERLLKATLELKVAMVGTTSQLKIAWQRTLLQHPAFRSMLMFGQTMKTVLTAPWKMLFGARGGYSSDVRRATATDNVYMKMVNLLSILYTKGMPKLDNIALYTKASAEAAVGREIKPGTSLTYTWFDKIREIMTSRSTVPFKTKAFDAFVDALELDKQSLRDAGVESLSDLFRPGRIARRAGISRENISEVMGDRTVEGTKAEAKQRGKDILFSLQELVRLKKNQEEREGPHSPSMAQNIAATAKTASADFKDRVKTEKKKLWTLDQIKKKAKEQVSKLGALKGYFSKMGKKIWSWFPILFGFLKNLFSPVWKLAKWLGLILGGGALKLGSGIAGSIGGAFAGGQTALAAGGVGGLAKWGIGGGAKLAGKAAAGAGGLLIGGVMSIGDAIRAIKDPEGFIGGIFARGISGFLGGTDSGLKGTARGTMKGAAIGAGIGSFIPGFGTLLGGAFGALTGGILGFVGGKNISKALSQALGDAKELISSIWKVVKFPYDFMKEGIKSFWILTKFLYKKLDIYLSTPGFIGEIWTALKNVVGGIWDAIMKMINSLKDVFTKFFTADWMQKLKKAAQEGIMAALFPISTIMKAYRWLRDKLDSTITKIPVIGEFYTSIKSIAKKISGGTLSTDLERALNPENPTPTNRASREWGNEIAKNRAREKESEKNMAEKISEKSAKLVVSKLEETGQTQTKAIILSTNSIISSNTNMINSSTTGGGGGGSSPGFSPGYNSAEKVAFCEIG